MIPPGWKRHLSAKSYAVDRPLVVHVSVSLAPRGKLVFLLCYAHRHLWKELCQPFGLSICIFPMVFGRCAFVGEARGSLSSILLTKTAPVRVSGAKPCSNIYSVITHPIRGLCVSHDNVCEGRLIQSVVGHRQLMPAVGVSRSSLPTAWSPYCVLYAAAGS